MGDVTTFPRGRGRSLSPQQIRAHRDVRLALLGKLLAALDDFRPALALDVDEAAVASLLAVRDHLSGLDLGSASLAGARPERLGRIAMGPLLAGRHMAELAKAAAGLLAQATTGQAVAPWYA